MIIESFETLVTGAIDAVEWAVNQAARLYEQIKSAVVGWVATAVADLTGCGVPCAEALELAAELALTSMGLPPSLPDFDALLNEGFDYLVEELATEAGVPPWIAEMAPDIAATIRAQARVTRGHPQARWLIADTGGRSSIVRLDVTRLGSAIEPRTHLWIMPGPPNDVWHRRVVELEVPPVGGGPVHIPVVLDPYLGGLPAIAPLLDHPIFGTYYGGPQRAEAWFQEHWGLRVGAVSCAHVEFWGSFMAPGGPIPIQRDAEFDMTNAQERALPSPFASECVP